MEQERKTNWLKFLLWTLGLLLAMYLLALLGYRLARKSAPQENDRDAQNASEYALPEESHTPFNLPTALQTIVPAEPSASAPPENNHDYLVIATNETVQLYLLTENGETVYAKDLPISLSALMPEDRQQLLDGIILGSEEELAFLLEDFGS